MDNIKVTIKIQGIFHPEPVYGHTRERMGQRRTIGRGWTSEGEVRIVCTTDLSYLWVSVTPSTVTVVGPLYRRFDIRDNPQTTTPVLHSEISSFGFYSSLLRLTLVRAIEYKH